MANQMVSPATLQSPTTARIDTTAPMVDRFTPCSPVAVLVRLAMPSTPTSMRCLLVCLCVVRMRLIGQLPHENAQAETSLVTPSPLR